MATETQVIRVITDPTEPWLLYCGFVAGFGVFLRTSLEIYKLYLEIIELKRKGGVTAVPPQPTPPQQAVTQQSSASSTPPTSADIRDAFEIRPATVEELKALRRRAIKSVSTGFITWIVLAVAIGWQVNSTKRLQDAGEAVAREKAVQISELAAELDRNKAKIAALEGANKSQSQTIASLQDRLRSPEDFFNALERFINRTRETLMAHPGPDDDLPLDLKKLLPREDKA